MRLHRLRITSFAAIGNVDVEFGPGLNVLYGPNDLGKSTVVAAIRLGLLLPHTSTHCDQYVGWTGADDPIVEMTFQTEEQRIWRIKKQFGKSGSSLLQESKNGQDFDDVERGRKVDAKLREILRWGIPEPGGSGGAKGLPTSFLATALLSPQDDVSAVLRESLQGDPTGSGKEQIAAALQAVAQDPLFLALLRNTQAQRDKAYTDKGAKKTAKGSVFKDAAERLNETREERDKLHRIVAESEGAERQLRDLTDRRVQRQETLAAAAAVVASLEQLASQATCRSVAAEQVRIAQEEVARREIEGYQGAGASLQTAAEPRRDRRARFMRLHRLRITSFAAIGNVDVEFGPGLNVLYGPNDLGKSTVVAAIRLGLLLPHTSTHCEQYVGWTGGDDPIVEMTFQTEEQRIWRIKKQFGKSGSSLLQESKNGQDFDDVERGRKVDAKLREILRWGIPEPGGSGGAKGLPTSFLATALLSPQDDVSAVLRDSLQSDPTGSGKEQIAAALQAVAQDPLFVALLRNTQARRDEAFTDKGAKKTAKGSVFKAAAERLNEARDEKDKLHRIVADSEGAERQLRELTDRRTQKQETLAAATALVENLERLASQATCRSVSAEQVQLAQEEVARIRRTGTEVEIGERKVAELVRKITEAEQALQVARDQQGKAVAALEAAEEAARAEGSDPGVTDTVVRQQLELRKSAADQAAREAQQRIDACFGCAEAY